MYIPVWSHILMTKGGNKLRRTGNYFWNNSIWALVGSDFHGTFYSLTNSRKQSFIQNLGKHSSISFCKLPFTNSTKFDINTWCQPKHWSLAERRESLHKDLSLHTSRCFLARLLVMTKLELKVIGDNYAVHNDSSEMLFQKFKIDLTLLLMLYS